MAKKRERLEVIRDILATVRDSNNAIRPTRLLQKSNLSPQMFKEYTEELIRKGFCEERLEKGRHFVLTTKGFEFLERYKVITEFIENFGLDD